MLLAPGLIKARGLYPPGMPLGNGALENLAVANEEPRAMRGHVMAGAAASWCAALLFTTCNNDKIYKDCLAK